MEILFEILLSSASDPDNTWNSRFFVLYSSNCADRFCRSIHVFGKCACRDILPRH